MTMEAMFSFTMKINGDLFTIRGNTIEEFKANVVAADSAIEMLGQLQGTPAAVMVSQVSRQSQSDEVITKPVSKAAATSNFNFLEEVEEAITQLDEVETVDDIVNIQEVNERSCKHGARKYIEGVSKRGKPYKGYFCQAKTFGEQCPPDYAV